MNSSDEDLGIIVPTMSVVEYKTTTTMKAFDTKNTENAVKFEFITIGIIGTIVILFGTFGNLLSIVVWSRKSMRSTTGTYLIALSVVGLLHMVFFVLTRSIPILHPEVLVSYRYGVFYSYVGYPFYMLLVSCNIWVTVGMTVDRCIKVRWSHLAQSMCTQRRAFISLGLVVFSCSLVNIPHFIVFEPVVVGTKNLTRTTFNLTEFGAADGRRHYEFWVQCMFFVIVPVMAVFTCNMLIICRVRTINRQVRSKKGAAGKMKSQKSEAQLTRLLLLVTFTFLVLNSFHCLTQCFTVLKIGDPSIVSKSSILARLGEIINSSINFVLYCISGRRFRKETMKILCWHEKDKRKTTTATTTTSTSAATINAVFPNTTPVKDMQMIKSSR